MAVIALVVVGGATRVMEAGLACPDWPLCFGSFLPGRQMNLQVFLEWFHRLDAFVIGMTLLAQLVVAFLWRSSLPGWMLKASLFLFLLVCLQGGLGALTVVNLVPSLVVTSHLALGLILIASLSGLSQRLLEKGQGLHPAPLWWRLMSSLSAFAVICQSLIGGRMATTWAVQRCLNNDQSCIWLDLHKSSAIPVACLICLFVGTALFHEGWPRSQWPFLLALLLLVCLQIILGLMTMNFALSKPLLTVSHQLVASVLVAILSALSFRRQKPPNLFITGLIEKTSLEPCHG